MSKLRLVPLHGLLLVLTLAAYLPLLKSGFIDFDDDLYVTKNPHVIAGFTPSSFSWVWTNDAAPYWLPVTWLSLQFDAHFFSARSSTGETVLSPAAFHGQNLFWHGCSVLLLFALWHRLTGALWRSFLVAALFAVHPMHVESVAWVTERKDVLSGFFGILALWAYARYVERPSWKRYLAIAAAFVVSLMCKPMLITLPLLLLLLDCWPLGRLNFSPSSRCSKRARLLIAEKVPLFILAMAFALLTMHLRIQHSSMIPLDILPLSARLMNALTAYGWYLSTTFWPTGLSILYRHPGVNWSPGAALAGATALAAMTAFGYWQAHRRPWLIVGWLWFVVVLFPVIGLAQGGAQAWADRFSYFSHIGLFGAVIWGGGELAGRLRVPRIVCASAVVFLLASCVVLTRTQVAYWHDATTIWEHAVAVTTDNDRAHEHLSRCYRAAGREDEADFHLDEAVRIQLKRLQRDRAIPRSGS